MSSTTCSGQLAPGQSLIEAQDVGVRYRILRERVSSFKEYILHRFGRPHQYYDFWALKGVSVVIESGEIVGIVGENGAGKSTLLKVMSRVLRPTEGRVVIKGQISSMLSLGAGFHPDMTGRENIAINATLLGYSLRRARADLDSVVEFAELEDFIDAPFRTYSAGMQARLGFAVATMNRPDVLLVDEVLAVGDAIFQEKCLRRIRGFREAGTAILLVSHSLDLIQSQCDQTLWLSHGEVRAYGASAEVLSEYRKFTTEREAAGVAAESER